VPRLCEVCRHFTPVDTPDVCPKGHGPLKFTLLPPPLQAAEPIPGLPGGRREPDPDDVVERPRSVGPLIRHPYAMPAGVIVLGLLGLTLFAWQSTGNDYDSRVKKLRPGMTMAEAAKVMGSETDRPRRPRRFPDIDMSVPTEGDGEVVWEHRTRAVKVTFRNGVVTGVEEVPATGGMRKRVTVVTAGTESVTEDEQ
jgi:hypothetical protein